MHVRTLQILCAAGALLATPAFAQSPNTATTYGTQGANAEAPSTHGAMAPASPGQNASPGRNASPDQTASSGMGVRSTLRQYLQKAGFTNIRIEPEVFVVHATDSAGHHVLMRVGPDSVTSVTALKGSGASQSGGSGGNAGGGNGQTSQ